MNINNYVRDCLREDIGRGDITTDLLIPANSFSEARIIVREAAVVCGIAIAKNIFKKTDPRSNFKIILRDGARARQGAMIALIKGKTRAILTAERVALNFIAHLSGIATLTRQFADAIKGTRAKILDTRKTTPGFRTLEKYAVRCGGGHNHRSSLDEMILIKDNHLSSVAGRWSIPEAVTRVKHNTRKSVEVEVDTFAQFTQALNSGTDMILLDNMKTPEILRCVRLRNQRGRRPLLEASGGIRLDNVRAVAKTGVDRISIGALTHSAPAVDFSLEILRSWTK